MVKLTENASAFVAANKKHKIIEGWVLDLKEGGGGYILSDGSDWQLSRDECCAIHESGNPPIWKI